MDVTSEKFVNLSEVAQITLPREVPNSGTGKLLRQANFQYPLSIDTLKHGTKTNVELKNGDLVANRSLTTVYLVSIKGIEKIYLSKSLILIRPRKESINSSFLLLYLQSETAKKCALKIQSGTVLHRLTLKGILSFPVPLPELEIQHKSETIFSTLYQSPPSNIEDYYKEIFSIVPPFIGKEAQVNSLNEYFRPLLQIKRKFVAAIVEDDLNEMDGCIRHKFYKSFLVLSGSVLEAILLDWLSEIEGINYFDKNIRDPSLVEVIKKIYKAGGLSSDAKDKADKLRNNRNIIHPRRHLSTGVILDKNICKLLIDDLREVLKQRNDKF